METDLERYAWLVAYELREARAAATPEERREHEGLARAYPLKMYALENETPAIPLAPEKPVKHELSLDDNLERPPLDSKKMGTDLAIRNRLIKG